MKIEDKIRRLSELLKEFKSFNNSDEWKEEVKNLIGEKEYYLCDDPYYDGCCLGWYIEGLKNGSKEING